MINKIGCVLSGGGARGFAHLGLLKLLEELSIKPYAIAGTSSGAIVGALYAAGKSPDAILELMKKDNFFGWSNLMWSKKAIFSMKTLREVLTKTVATDDFDALPIKLFVASTDLNKGKAVIISKGELIKAVIASAAVPVLFEPVIMGNQLLVDGGLLNNFPVEPLESICDCIIGLHVNKMEAGIEKSSLFHTFNMMEHCFHLAIANTVYSKINKCDVFIEPSLHEFDMFEIKNADKIFEIGYQSARKQQSALLKLTDIIKKK